MQLALDAAGGDVDEAAKILAAHEEGRDVVLAAV